MLTREQMKQAGYCLSNDMMERALATLGTTDDVQNMLANCPLELRAVTFDKYSDSNGTVTDRQGKPRPIIYRRFTGKHDIWQKYFMATLAYRISRLIGFQYAVPASTMRSVTFNGQTYDGWIQDAWGRNFGDFMSELAQSRYGNHRDKTCWQLIAADTNLLKSLKEAFICRLVLGEVDNHCGNFLAVPVNGLIYAGNVDFEYCLPADSERKNPQTPIWGRCRGGNNFLNCLVARKLSNTPIPKDTRELLFDFVKLFANHPEILTNFPLSAEQVDGLVMRTNWFVRNNRFPKYSWLKYYFAGEPSHIAPYLESIRRA
jgi:hypothetical protein